MSHTRSASSSPMRTPRPLCAITMARYFGRTVRASRSTCSTVSGTIRSRSWRGRMIRTNGERAIWWSATAAANTARTNLTSARSVVGAMRVERSVTHACTSDARTVTRCFLPSAVPSTWLRMYPSTRSAVPGPYGRVAA